MARIRRCFTCKVVFPTIDAVNDHYRQTSHKPLPYNCESCERAYQHLRPLQTHVLSKHPHSPFPYLCEPCNRVFNFKTMSSLLDHFQSEHPHLPLPYNCESCRRIFLNSTGLRKHYETKRHRRFQGSESVILASSVISQIDVGDLDSQRDDDFDDDDDRNTNVNGWDSPEEDVAQRDPTLVENPPSVLLSDDMSKPVSSVSELTSPSPSLSAAAGSSSSKSDKATALARAALRNRFAELGVSKSGETTPLFKSNVWGLRKTNSSGSNLDKSSVATNLADEKGVNDSELPLNSIDNNTRPFTCPGCQIDFKSFSGFVLHIESRLCRSSMCHEIEDQLNACVTQIFNTRSKWQGMNTESSRLDDTGGL